MLALRRLVFFDPQPAFASPTLDYFGILLAGDCAGLLRPEAQLTKHPRDVAQVVLDAEAVADELDHPDAGPQVSREVRLAQTGGNQLNQLVTLRVGELAFTTGVRLGGEGAFAPFTPSTPPAFRAAAIDTETFGHRADGLPGLEARCNATA